MSRRISRFLTPAAERVLRWMKHAGVEGDLVQERGEVWYGLHRTSGAVLHRLLRLCLIREETEWNEERHRRWTLNEDGRRIVEDPEYEPPALALWRERLRREEAGEEEARRERARRLMSVRRGRCPGCGFPGRRCARSVAEMGKLACCPDCEHPVLDRRRGRVPAGGKAP